MSAAGEEAALLGLAPVAPVRTVAYGPHPDQVVDLYGRWPEPGSRSGAGAGPGGPLVVLLHGGFWRAAYDRRHLSPCADALARHGLSVALAEYRRVGAGGGAPRTFADVAAAIGTAVGAAVGAVPGPGAAAGAGGEPGGGSGGAAGAGPGRRGVVLVGHSAGGHLALLAAARPGPPVARVVAVAPVADLARAHELGLSDGAVAELLGPGPGFAERLAAADPMAHPPAGVPVTLLHGTADLDVPPDLSRRYAAAHPTATELRELPDVGHYAPVTPGTAAFRTLLALLADEGRQTG
ncbi:alpha/beta hydrolase family protein [Streptomyces sp. GS7]|uniref:alpha/beta hydrolase family protein n=1 Tax=Streptomyces sp. GS7 TaxID=2692234 RepID=UPI0013177C98|nr:prolyl oligopeptidase family serine peptidase [Streptomyces sp. GS7]QHC20264.1 prolyl oligopeptidase family serine peptidase [Streptomyces sp. GS7]